MKTAQVLEELLPEVDSEEIVIIERAAVANRIRQIKLAIADAILAAKIAVHIGDSARSSSAEMKQVKEFKKQYDFLQVEWKRLGGDQSEEESE